METNPSQKSTGNSKADDVADFERKASEPMYSLMKFTTKKTMTSPTLEHTDKTTYITTLPYI